MSSRLLVADLPDSLNQERVENLLDRLLEKLVPVMINLRGGNQVNTCHEILFRLRWFFVVLNTYFIAVV